MIKRDIVIVDHISMISANKVDPTILEKLNIRIKNVRKYRGRIERRKEKIKIGYQKSYNEQKKPGETFEQWHKGLNERVNKQALKNQRKGDGDGGLIDTGKNKSTACKNC